MDSSTLLIIQMRNLLAALAHDGSDRLGDGWIHWVNSVRGEADAWLAEQEENR